MAVRDAAVEAYKEALPAFAASLVGGPVVGVVLGGMRAELRAVPGLFVLIPMLLVTRGNVYGSLGARIAIALHQGLIEPRVTGGDERLRVAVTAAFADGVFTSMLVAVVTYFLLTFLGSRVVPLPILVSVAIAAGLLFGIVLTAVVVSVAFAGYHRERNSDTIVDPVVTVTGDMFGVLFLLIAARTVLAVTGVF